MTHRTKNRMVQARAAWGLACLALVVALGAIAAARGSGEVAGVLMVPVLICFAMATPLSDLSTPRGWVARSRRLP